MLRAAAGRPADERKLLIEKICHHLYEVETPDALPPEVRASVRALRDSQA
jgi:hypothetical protein